MNKLPSADSRLQIKTIIVGPLWVNSYIVWDRDTREGILVDPGDEGKKLISFIKKNTLQIRSIVITHGHFDHIKDADYVSTALQAPVSAHRAELPFIEHAAEQSAMFGFPPIRPPHVDTFLDEGDTLALGSGSLEVHHVPGHSPGSIMLHSRQDRIAVVGDLIFYESVGRTDLPAGDYETLLLSIRNHILSLPDDTRILPGHGEETTVGHEKVYNPFITGVFRDEG